MVAGMFELFGGGFFGQGDLDDGEEAFFVDSYESLFARFPDINNFTFVDMNDLMKAFDFSA